MSCNYAENLSHYENKGKLGLPEIFDSQETIEDHCNKLAKLLKDSDHTVVHTGAGISTSAGIPDFRGPNGVWTLEKAGKKPSINVSWNDAKPTKTHMAIKALQKAGYISYIITQNIDGLHLRSGIPRRLLAELHGNLFVHKCGTCNRQFVRSEAVETVGCKFIGMTCPGTKKSGRRCRGKLQDTILDWEDSLPEDDLELSRLHSCSASLSLCLGTTLQIVPSGNLPVFTKKRGGKLVICNLQPTKQDKYADLLIHSYVDDVMTRVLEILEIPIPEYKEEEDPVCITRNILNDLGYQHKSTQQSAENQHHKSTQKASLIIPKEYPNQFAPIDWTIPEEWVNDENLVMKAKMRKVCNGRRSASNKNKKTDCKEEEIFENPDCKGKIFEIADCKKRKMFESLDCKEGKINKSDDCKEGNINDSPNCRERTNFEIADCKKRRIYKSPGCIKGKMDKSPDCKEEKIGKNFDCKAKMKDIPYCKDEKMHKNGEGPDCKDGKISGSPDCKEEKTNDFPYCKEEKIHKSTDCNDDKIGESPDCKEEKIDKRPDCKEVKIDDSPDCKEVKIEESIDCKEVTFDKSPNCKEVKIGGSRDCKEEKIDENRDCKEVKIDEHHDCKEMKIDEIPDCKEVKIDESPDCKEVKIDESSDCKEEKIAKS